MEPEIWGPPGWIFLHTITLNYPHKPTEYDKEHYKNFFLNLQNVLPCQYCTHNYKLHLKKYPIDKFLDSKKSLVKWLIHIHNEVNIIFNKKTITYDEFIQIYKNIYNTKTDTKKNYTKYIIIFIISVILLITIILFKFQAYFAQFLIPQKTLYSLFR
tara:strand:+ start:514 stop:984 length:471 start_codon:yes stop_codon:yes gene_type:complete